MCMMVGPQTWQFKPVKVCHHWQRPLVRRQWLRDRTVLPPVRQGSARAHHQRFKIRRHAHARVVTDLPGLRKAHALGNVSAAPNVHQSRRVPISLSLWRAMHLCSGKD